MEPRFFKQNSRSKMEAVESAETSEKSPKHKIAGEQYRPKIIFISVFEAKDKTAIIWYILILFTERQFDIQSQN